MVDKDKVSSLLLLEADELNSWGWGKNYIIAITPICELLLLALWKFSFKQRFLIIQSAQ